MCRLAVGRWRLRVRRFGPAVHDQSVGFGSEHGVGGVPQTRNHCEIGWRLSSLSTVHVRSPRGRRSRRCPPRMPPTYPRRAAGGTGCPFPYETFVGECNRMRRRLRIRCASAGLQFAAIHQTQKCAVGSPAQRLQEPDTRRACPAQYGSRITLRWIFPTGLRGNGSSMNMIWLGFL